MASDHHGPSGYVVRGRFLHGEHVLPHGLPEQTPEREVRERHVAPERLRGRTRVHLHPALAGRRPDGLRAGERAVEPGADRGDHHALHHLHALLAQRREPGEHRRREAVPRRPRGVQEEGRAVRAQVAGDVSKEL